MIEYQGMEYQIDVRNDRQYFCRIYNQGLPLPGPTFFTNIYPTEEEAIEAAKQKIRDYLAMTGEP
jgi:hypothetical protein